MACVVVVPLWEASQRAARVTDSSAHIFQARRADCRLQTPLSSCTDLPPHFTVNHSDWSFVTTEPSVQVTIPCDDVGL